MASELAALNDLEVKRNKLALQTGVSANRLDPLKAKVPLELPSPDSADSWVRQAEDGSYALAIRRKQLIVAGKQVDISRSGHLPTVSLVAGYNDRTSTQLASVDTRGGSVGVQVTLPIFSGGLAQSKVREARALEEQARQDLEDARRQVEQATRTAYLGVTSGAAQVTAREQVLASSKSQLDATRLGREVGVRTSVGLAQRRAQGVRIPPRPGASALPIPDGPPATGRRRRPAGPQKVLEGVNQLLQARQSTALASAQPKPNKIKPPRASSPARNHRPHSRGPNPVTLASSPPVDGALHAIRLHHSLRARRAGQPGFLSSRLWPEHPLSARQRRLCRAGHRRHRAGVLLARAAARHGQIAARRRPTTPALKSPWSPTTCPPPSPAPKPLARSWCKRRRTCPGADHRLR